MPIYVGRAPAGMITQPSAAFTPLSTAAAHIPGNAGAGSRHSMQMISIFMLLYEPQLVLRASFPTPVAGPGQKWIDIYPGERFSGPTDRRPV